MPLKYVKLIVNTKKRESTTVRLTHDCRLTLPLVIERRERGEDLWKEVDRLYPRAHVGDIFYIEQIVVEAGSESLKVEHCVKELTGFLSGATANKDKKAILSLQSGLY